MREYFGKIQNHGFFAEFYSNTAPEYINEVRNGRFVIRREKELDFSFFAQRYGYEMPEILKTYYSYCHPPIIGSHSLSPYKTEVMTLYSTMRRDCFGELISAAEYWEKYDVIDVEKYVPIGSVSYNDSFVVLERASGRIFVEFGFAENPADDAEGKLYDVPLAEDLETFICEIEPPQPSRYALR